MSKMLSYWKKHLIVSSPLSQAVRTYRCLTQLDLALREIHAQSVEAASWSRGELVSHRLAGGSAFNVPIVVAGPGVVLLETNQSRPDSGLPSPQAEAIHPQGAV